MAVLTGESAVAVGVERRPLGWLKTTPNFEPCQGQRLGTEEALKGNKMELNHHYVFLVSAAGCGRTPSWQLEQSGDTADTRGAKTQSEWVEAYPTRRADAISVAKKLMTELIPRFEVPLTINSDHRPHFISQIQKALSKALGFIWKFHTPYHPASSGKVKQLNRDIKTKLPKLCKQTGLPWPDILPIVLMHLKNMPNRKHGLTPHEILFKRPMNVGLSPIRKLKQLIYLKVMKMC